MGGVKWLRVTCGVKVARELVVSLNAPSLYLEAVLSSVSVTHQDEKWLISFAHHGNQPTLVLCEALQILLEVEIFFFFFALWLIDGCSC